MKLSLQLRCYCCGEEVGLRVALVTMSPDSVDRVFVALPEHLENFDEATTLPRQVVQLHYNFPLA